MTSSRNGAENCSCVLTPFIDSRVCGAIGGRCVPDLGRGGGVEAAQTTPSAESVRVDPCPPSPALEALQAILAPRMRISEDPDDRSDWIWDLEDDPCR